MDSLRIKIFTFPRSRIKTMRFSRKHNVAGSFLLYVIYTLFIGLYLALWGLKENRIMKLSILSKLAIYLLIFPLFVLPAMSDDSNDKKVCDSIGQKEIQDMLVGTVIEGAPVLYIKESSLAGICEVAINNGSQPVVFYVDSVRTHMIFGSLVNAKTMINLTSQAAKAIQDKKRVDLSKIPLNNALVLGDDKAEKKVIIFTDPDCPYCSSLHLTLKQIVDKRKDISFYIKLYPLASHKEAYAKSKSIICNKSLLLLEDCFNKKQITKTECGTDEIDNNIKLVESLGISGTPAIILPDGRLRFGDLPEIELTNLIDGKL